jgi:hypothetical protein
VAIKTQGLVALLKRVAALPEGELERLADVMTAAGKGDRMAKGARRTDRISYLTPEETANLFKVTKDVFELALTPRRVSPRPPGGRASWAC